MNTYIEIIKTAVIFFPFIAFLISIPFILMQYHKYGSISFLKALITYSFTLYFICAYFLIILPLPDVDAVAKLTTPRMQLIPFSFVMDFIKNTSFKITNVHTYLSALKESYFFVPIYNIFLTIPFGIYLSYYFKCDLKKVLSRTFLLSLFFELTQLSGLYFIYPRGYRLFDVDDLLLNTLGGVLGYFIAKPLIKILPKVEKINDDARKKGKEISGLRRTTAFVLDLFILFVLEVTISLIVKKWVTMAYIAVAIIYYVIIPIFLNGATLGRRYLNIQVQDYNKKVNIQRYILRELVFTVIYIGMPFAFSFCLKYIPITDGLRVLLACVLLLYIFLVYFITMVRYLFTTRDMIYEKLSKTKLVSTIK